MVNAGVIHWCHCTGRGLTSRHQHVLNCCGLLQRERDCRLYLNLCKLDQPSTAWSSANTLRSDPEVVPFTLSLCHWKIQYFNQDFFLVRILLGSQQRKNTILSMQENPNSLYKIQFSEVIAALMGYLIVVLKNNHYSQTLTINVRTGCKLWATALSTSHLLSPKCDLPVLVVCCVSTWEAD